jgi:hypothetical protein
MYLCVSAFLIFHFIFWYFSIQSEEQSDIQSSLRKLQEQISFTQETQQQKLQEVVEKMDDRQQTMDDRQQTMEEHQRKLQESVEIIHQMVSKSIYPCIYFEYLL